MASFVRKVGVTYVTFVAANAVSNVILCVPRARPPSAAALLPGGTDRHRNVFSQLYGAGVVLPLARAGRRVAA